MNDVTQTALTRRLLALADDELLLAHRDAEWTGHAPILEEDIALANLAQDELGHAMLWYEQIEVLTGDAPDDLAFFRNPDAFRNAQLVELPKGDWAFTMLRHYLFDVYETLLLAELVASRNARIAAAAAKMQREELYHLRHTQTWVSRLGLGSDEANRRMQAALNVLWPLAGQLFVPLPDDPRLTAEGIFPDVAALYAPWHDRAAIHLAAAALAVPDGPPLAAPRTEHTPHLAALLDDMQRVARSDPEATW